MTHQMNLRQTQLQNPIEARLIRSHDFLIRKAFRQALDLASSNLVRFANIILVLRGRNATCGSEVGVGSGPTSIF